MIIELLRFCSRDHYTLGSLFLDKRFLCFTLEDEYREFKVHGRTRIPAGVYEVTLRREGQFHIDYSRMFPDIHKGMLHLENVPNFLYILFHIGNWAKDTEGCILVGASASANYVSYSRKTYLVVYPLIANRIASGERCLINVVDYDIPLDKGNTV